jgi:hypothetical protein
MTGHLCLLKFDSDPAFRLDFVDEVVSSNGAARRMWNQMHSVYAAVIELVRELVGAPPAKTSGADG